MWGLVVVVLALAVQPATTLAPLGALNAPTLLEQHVAREFYAALSELGSPEKPWWHYVLPRWWAGGEKKDEYAAARDRILGTMLLKEKFMQFTPLLNFWPSWSVLGHAYGQYLDLFGDNLPTIENNLIHRTHHHEGFRMNKAELHARISGLFRLTGGIDLAGMDRRSHNMIENMVYEWDRMDFDSGKRRETVSMCDFLREKYVASGKLLRTDIETTREKFKRIPATTKLNWNWFELFVCGTGSNSSTASVTLFPTVKPTSDDTLSASELAIALEIPVDEEVDWQTLKMRFADLFLRVAHTIPSFTKFSSISSGTISLPGASSTDAKTTLTKFVRQVGGSFNKVSLAALMSSEAITAIEKESVSQKTLELFDIGSGAAEISKLVEALRASLCSTTSERRLLAALWRVFNFDEHLTTRDLDAWKSTYTISPCEFQLLQVHFSQRRFEAVVTSKERYSNHVRRLSSSLDPWATWYDFYAHSSRGASTINLRKTLKSTSTSTSVSRVPQSLTPQEFRLLLQGVEARDRILQDGPEWHLGTIFQLTSPESQIPKESDARSQYSKELYNLIRCNPEKLLRSDVHVRLDEVVSFYRHLESVAKTSPEYALQASLYTDLKPFLQKYIGGSSRVSFCKLKQALNQMEILALVNKGASTATKTIIEDALCANWCEGGMSACREGMHCVIDPHSKLHLCEPDDADVREVEVMIVKSTHPLIAGIYTKKDDVYVNGNGMKLVEPSADQKPSMWKLVWNDQPTPLYAFSCASLPNLHDCQILNTFTMSSQTTGDKDTVSVEFGHSRLTSRMITAFIPNAEPRMTRETVQDSIAPVAQRSKAYDEAITSVFLAIKCNPDYDPTKEKQGSKNSGITESDLASFYVRSRTTATRSTETQVMANGRASRVMRQYLYNPNVNEEDRSHDKLNFNYFMASLHPYPLQYEGIEEKYSRLLERVLYIEDQFHMFWACLSKFSSVLVGTSGKLSKQDLKIQAERIETSIFPEQTPIDLGSMLATCLPAVQDGACLQKLTDFAEEARSHTTIRDPEIAAADKINNLFQAHKYCAVLDELKKEKKTFEAELQLPLPADTLLED